MAKTKIEWAEHVWNPVVGCSIRSPGCTNCYAMGQAARIERMKPEWDHYRALTKMAGGRAVWTGKLALVERALQVPLSRKKPTIYF
ncbi:DUF5131 family protein, partial [Acinetobacter baumannii]